MLLCRSSLIVWSVVLSCLGAAVPASAQTAGKTMQVTKPIYPWRTESQTKADKDFSHCQVKNMYDNGILLLIAENTDHRRRLVLNFPQDKLITQESYDLEWQVDRQPTQPVRAVAGGSRVLAIAMDDTMTRQIGRGNMLFLRGPNDALVFDMAGAQDAIRSLQDCLVSHNVKPAPIVFGPNGQQIAPASAPVPATAMANTATPPVAVKAAPAPVVAAPAAAPAKTVQPADKAIPTALADQLRAAGLAPKNVVQLSDSEQAKQPFDVLWAQNPFSIGLKSEPPLPHQAMPQIAAKYSQKLQAVCNGEFLAEGGAVEKRGDVYVMPAEVACAPRDNQGQKTPNTVSAMLLIMDTRTLHIVFIEAPQNAGAQAVQLRDKLMAQCR